MKSFDFNKYKFAYQSSSVSIILSSAPLYPVLLFNHPVKASSVLAPEYLIGSPPLVKSWTVGYPLTPFSEQTSLSVVQSTSAIATK